LCRKKVLGLTNFGAKMHELSRTAAPCTGAHHGKVDRGAGRKDRPAIVAASAERNFT
jgi:hypothetical protein